MMQALMNSVRKVTQTDQALKISDAIALLSSYEGTKIVNINSARTASDLTTPARYYTTGAFLSGKPANVANDDRIQLDVIQDKNGNLAQLFFVNNVVWARRNNADGWSDWTKLGGSKARPNGFLPHYERGLSVCRLAAL